MFLFSFVDLPNVFAISGCIQMLSSYAATRVLADAPNALSNSQPWMINTNQPVLTMQLVWLYNGSDIDYLTSLRSVFSTWPISSEELGVEMEVTTGCRRKSVRLTIGLKTARGHWLHSSCHCHCEVTAPAQCHRCGSFPGWIRGKRRDWQLSPPPTVDVLLE